MPFSGVMFRVLPAGMALALGGVGYSVLATFVTLFYASRHWGGAALCLTAFGVAFILARLLFIQTINRFGRVPDLGHLPVGGDGWNPAAVERGLSLDSFCGCRPGRIWLFAGLPGTWC